MKMTKLERRYEAAKKTARRLRESHKSHRMLLPLVSTATGASLGALRKADIMPDIPVIGTNGLLGLTAVGLGLMGNGTAANAALAAGSTALGIASYDYAFQGEIAGDDDCEDDDDDDADDDDDDDDDEEISG